MIIPVSVTVNGEVHEVSTNSNRTLADFLRDELRLTGTKVACGTGDCGACSVILDGQLVTSCLILAVEAHAGKVLTVEGLSPPGCSRGIQEQLVIAGGVQCGFCTPGMVVAAHALLQEHPQPTDDQIKAGLSGNLCRCTGYKKISQAIKASSMELAT